MVARMFPEESRGSVHGVGVQSSRRASSSTQEEPSYRSILPPRACSPPSAGSSSSSVLWLFDTLQHTAVLTFTSASHKLLKCSFFTPLWTYNRISTGNKHLIFTSKPRASFMHQTNLKTFTQVQFWGTLHEYFPFLPLYTSTPLHSGGKTVSLVTVKTK